MKKIITIALMLLSVLAFSQVTPSAKTKSKSASTNGGCDGSIEVIMTSGTAPYVYVWNTGATTTKIDNLCVGSYSCTITDANGYFCFLDGQIVTQPPQSSGMYLDVSGKEPIIYDLTTDKINVSVPKTTLIPVPVDCKQLAKVSLKGQVSGVIPKGDNKLYKWFLNLKTISPNSSTR